MKPDSKTDGLHLDEISIRLVGRTLLCLSAPALPGILTVMGPSGSGKLPLLAYFGGFLDPVHTGSGRIFIDGRDITGIPAEKRQAGMLFQDPWFPQVVTIGEEIGR